MEAKVKKKHHVFEIYITKKLKEVSEKKISIDAIYQLNNILCILSKILSDICFKLTTISKKKTISLKELSNSIHIVFPKIIADDIVVKYLEILEKFNTNSKYSNRNVKAGIIFSPSLLEKFLRGFGYKKIMVTAETPIALATTIEYITQLILDLIIIHMNERERINSKDILSVVEENKVLKMVFDKYNIKLIHRKYTVPFTYTYNKENKYIIKQYINNKKLNKEITHILPKFSFERIVRNIIKNNYNIDIKISKETFSTLQNYVEEYVIDLLHSSYFAALHAKRIKLIPADINLILAIKNNDIENYIKVKTEVV